MIPDTVSTGRGTGSQLALLLARLLIASLFVFSGLEKCFDYGGAVAYATAHGIPYAATLMWLVIALELVSSAMLISGWHARAGAAALLVWVLWTGPWFHRFWVTPQPMWQMMVDDFFHHLVMAGGLIYVIVFGPGTLAMPGSKNPSAS
jgi:putative oxidoreductase